MNKLRTRDITNKQQWDKARSDLRSQIDQLEDQIIDLQVPYRCPTGALQVAYRCPTGGLQVALSLQALTLIIDLQVALSLSLSLSLRRSPSPSPSLSRPPPSSLRLSLWHEKAGARYMYYVLSLACLLDLIHPLPLLA